MIEWCPLLLICIYVYLVIFIKDRYWCLRWCAGSVGLCGGWRWLVRARPGSGEWPTAGGVITGGPNCARPGQERWDMWSFIVLITITFVLLSTFLWCLLPSCLLSLLFILVIYFVFFSVNCRAQANFLSLKNSPTPFVDLYVWNKMWTFLDKWQTNRTALPTVTVHCNYVITNISN